MNSRVAAIDFGTNTARLLVAELRENGFEHVHLEREIVRMGGGFSREEGLSGDAQRRGLDCLQRFAGIISSLNVSQVRAVATSAVRDAANGPAFVESVLRTTGIELAVIDGIREGELTLAGVLAGLDRQDKELFVFDVGGGSTEYTLARDGRAQFVRSLPLGVVRLTEGKVTPEAVSEKIGRELELLLLEMATSHSKPTPDATLVGTAGTATTLAAIAMEMKDYDYRKVNNATISRQQIEAIYERMLPMSPEERLTVPGLERGREDLIIAGILITLHTMERFGFDSLKVSDYGLLEGLIVSGAVAGS
ncbi:exopolyphosphatase [Geobacter sp. AOG2]|uniref:Ppx/GppA phosphatase family protein n=1 Tax=Geobacter sp. AOG2 TaxID=1566347 RepID=UPI001CC63098|nr:exopolyphosphatase [Geobacter sp. AOG2]GFE60997.1 exopolyphosphatase [Geobacter sp. AOG2]